MPQRKKGPAAPSRGRRKAAGRSVKAAPGDTGAPGQDLPFPVVAVGASAGGIEATSALLHALPPDTGMAFVVIQHLSPAHKSMLAGILGRAASMPVSELTQDTATEPNHVYVLPPNRNLAWGIGVLRLEPRTEAPGHARPVDHFMRSLAEGHGHKAIGVVLSGTANDGTLGLEEIKAAGGITFAQDTTAEQEGMPGSAIASGAVDYVLPPGEIARELARIARHPHIAPSGSDAAATPDPAFTRILEMLREGTGVDFSSYKRNTLHRRVTRRMVLHKLENLSDYAAYVQAHAEEVSALYTDETPCRSGRRTAPVGGGARRGRPPSAVRRLRAAGCGAGR